jgi:hypothetical protein
MLSRRRSLYNRGFACAMQLSFPTPCESAVIGMWVVEIASDVELPLWQAFLVLGILICARVSIRLRIKVPSVVILGIR